MRHTLIVAFSCAVVCVALVVVVLAQVTTPTQQMELPKFKPLTDYQSTPQTKTYDVYQTTYGVRDYSAPAVTIEQTPTTTTIYETKYGVRDYSKPVTVIETK